MLTRIARDKALPLDPPLSDRERASALRGAAPSREADFYFAVNERVVDEATAVLGALDLSINEAVGWMLARVAQGAVPPFSPNATTVAALEAAKRGEVFSSGSVDQLLADLNADD